MGEQMGQIKRMRRGESVIGEITTDSVDSSYGLPVYKCYERPGAGDDLLVASADDDGLIECEARCIWTDGVWAVLQVPAWGDQTVGMHIDSGRVGALMADNVLYTVLDDEDALAVIRGEWGPVRVYGAIHDFTGQTLALVL